MFSVRRLIHPEVTATPSSLSLFYSSSPLEPKGKKQRARKGSLRMRHKTLAPLCFSGEIHTEHKHSLLFSFLFYCKRHSKSPCIKSNVFCILIKISITTVNKYKRYKRVYFFLPSVLGNTRIETQIIKAYANHTMLTAIHAWRVLWCPRSHPTFIGRDLN